MGDIQARTVLWYLAFVGFAVNYMLRINLNITIVDMVRQTKSSSSSKSPSAECFDTSVKSPIVNHLPNNWTTVDYINGTDVYESLENISNKSSIFGTIISNASIETVPEMQNKTKAEKFSLERKFFEMFNIDYDKQGFSWNEYQQGLVLGSYYWLHWATQIPGGILAKKYGTKLVFGLSNVVGSWLCFLLPLASYWDYRVLIVLRVFQGMVVGLAWPAMHHLTGQWIPPNERSKFVTAYLGSSVGIAVFYPVFGYIIAWSSWELVFHVCGIIGTIWYLGWLVYVFDSPAKHPRISSDERNYIEKALGSSVNSGEKNPTPWKEILTSRAVWMNVVAQWGGIWGLFTLMTQAPTYFKLIHGWNIHMTGILSGLPHVMRMAFAYVFSLLGDYLLRSEKLSRTNVRKLATFMCCIVKGVFVLALAYSGCNSLAAIVFLTLATAVHGAVSTGPLASVVDISPNHAGIVLGISGMIGVIPGFISPAIVGILTLGNQTVTSWKYVFLISSGMLLASGILYVLFSESNLQSWNSPKKSEDKEREMQPLNGDKEKEAATEPLMKS